MIPQERLEQLPLEVVLLLQAGTLAPMEVTVLNALVLRNPTYLQELSERKALEPYLTKKGDQLQDQMEVVIPEMERKLEKPQTDDTMRLISYHNQVRKSAIEHLLAEILPPPEDDEE